MKKQTAWDNYVKIAADFETTYHKEFDNSDFLAENKDTGDHLSFTPNESSQVFLAGAMEFETKEYRLSYESIPDFIDNCVAMIAKQGKKRGLVYFHNLAYDGDYILKWLLKNGYRQSININEQTHKPKLTYKEFALLKSGGKFFSLELWWRGIYIKFLDSLKLFPVKLENLGELIGAKKLKDTVDYTKFKLRKDHKYPKKWLTYLKRDVEIMVKFMIKFFKEKKEACTTTRQTIGSVAYSHIKGIIKDRIPNFTIKDYYQWEWWYHGGLCFPSHKYWGKWAVAPQRIKMLDIVSSYPTAMCQYLPYGKALKYKPNGSYCTFYKIHIKEALIKKKYEDIGCMWKPFELNKRHQRMCIVTDTDWLYQYLQYIKDQDYYVIDCELDMWKEIYDIKYTVKEQWYYQTAPYLKDVVMELFKDKQNATNDTTKLLAKLIINNLYGKTGQKPIRPQDFYGPYEDIDQEQYEILGQKTGILGGYIIQRKKKDTEKAQPIFLASYITALARVKLLKRYQYITNHGGRFLYCDTDSVAFIDKTTPIKFNDIGKELGNWEYEKFKVADGFCALCPKQYRVVVKNNPFPVKFACAGCKKDQMAKVENIDYNYDLGDNKKYNIHKTQLKDDLNGKTIWDTSFSFIKWKRLKKNPVFPKELR